MLKCIKLDNIPEGLKIATRRYFTDGNLQALVLHHFARIFHYLRKAQFIYFLICLMNLKSTP